MTMMTKTFYFPWYLFLLVLLFADDKCVKSFKLGEKLHLWS